MRTTLAFALLLAAACSKKEPAPAAAPASDATAAPVTTAATATATATVAGTAPVTDAATATATATAPVPALPAPAGAFYLVSPTRLDADLVLAATDSTTLTYGPGTELVDRPDDDTFAAVRLVEPPPPEHAALIGVRVGLHDAKRETCQATIGAIAEVRSGRIWGDITKRNAITAADVWDTREDTRVEGRYLAAALTDITGDCGEPLFAVAAGRKIETVALTAAKDWEGEAMAAFEETSAFSNAEMKSDLEGGPGGKTISARRIVAKSGPSLALVYANLAGERSIGVFSVPDPATFAGATYRDTVTAPAPSTVVGVDADGDGKLDVVIGHAGGVALIPANGEAVNLRAGALGSW